MGDIMTKRFTCGDVRMFTVACAAMFVHVHVSERVIIYTVGVFVSFGAGGKRMMCVFVSGLVHSTQTLSIYVGSRKSQSRGGVSSEDGMP